MTDETAQYLRRGAMCIYLVSWVLPATSGDAGWMSLGVGTFVLSVLHCISSVFAVVTILADPSWETVITICSGFYFGFLAFGNAWVFERMFARKVNREKWALIYTLAAWCVPVVFILLPDMNPTSLTFGYYCWALGLTFILIDPRRPKSPENVENHKVSKDAKEGNGSMPFSSLCPLCLRGFSLPV